MLLLRPAATDTVRVALVVACAPATIALRLKDPPIESDVPIVPVTVEVNVAMALYGVPL